MTTKPCTKSTKRSRRCRRPACPPPPPLAVNLAKLLVALVAARRALHEAEWSPLAGEGLIPMLREANLNLEELARRTLPGIGFILSKAAEEIALALESQAGYDAMYQIGLEPPFGWQD